MDDQPQPPDAGQDYWEKSRRDWEKRAQLNPSWQQPAAIVSAGNVTAAGDLKGGVALNQHDAGDKPTWDEIEAYINSKLSGLRANGVCNGDGSFTITFSF